MAADPKEQPLDFRKVLEQSASKTTLQELAKKGIQRVKVLDEAAITRMINEAVERILANRTNLVSKSDRTKIIAASRKELDKLMKEFQKAKDRSELMQKDKEALAAEVENLQEQAQIQRKYTDGIGKQRYDEGKATVKEEIAELKEQLSAARREGGEEARIAQQAVIEEIRNQAAARESQVRSEVVSQKDAELNQKLLEASREEAVRREELQAQNLEMSGKLTETIREMKKSDEELFTKLTELFTKSISDVNRKLADLKTRSIAGGAGGSSFPGDVEFRPSQAMLDNMLNETLESNLKKMDVEGKTAGKIGNALDRLRSLRGEKPDKKKKDES